MVIKPIETRYAGCLFRSRTEARWAVFFDALRLEWEYEKEGYPLKFGWYLPDFYLPLIGVFFEVKGQRPTTDEICLAGCLQMETSRTVFISEGAPVARQKLWRLPIPMTEEEARRGSCDLEPRYYFGSDPDYDDGISFISDNADLPSMGPFLQGTPSFIKAAYEKARSARFERRK
jgi:hypothetical protein